MSLASYDSKYTLNKLFKPNYEKLRWLVHTCMQGVPDASVVVTRSRNSIPEVYLPPRRTSGEAAAPCQLMGRGSWGRRRKLRASVDMYIGGECAACRAFMVWQGGWPVEEEDETASDQGFGASM